MPAIRDTILQSPLITPQQNRYTQIYAETLQPYLGVSIGQPVLSSPPWIEWLKTLYSTPERETATTPTLLQACKMIKYAETTYGTINTNISNISDGATNVTVQDNTVLQQQVDSLTKKRNSLQEDAEVAELRDNVLRSGNGSVSNHQVYLLGRPLRPATIPYLWALSVLFIGIATLIFYMFFPYTIPPLDVILFDLYLLFSSPWIWSILFGLASVVILFLSLRITNLI